MSSPATAALLEVSGVTVRFGGITALDQVSFAVMPATIAGLIGPNGAGKTTLFNCLSRLYTFSEGQILFEGHAAHGDGRPHRIAALGIGRTFQNLALFRTMSVWQNVMLGGHCRSTSGFPVERAAPAACAARRAGAGRARLRGDRPARSGRGGADRRWPTCRSARKSGSSSRAR